MGSATTPKKSPPASDWMVRQWEIDEEEEEEGMSILEQDAEMVETMEMFGLFLVCDADSCMQGELACFLSMYVLI